jgi:hypothetical protein
MAPSLDSEPGAGRPISRDAAEALAIIAALGVTFDLAPDNGRAIEIAVEVERHSAYDAAYLALAERLEAEVWALDGPLARNAGNPVKLISQLSPSSSAAVGAWPSIECVRIRPQEKGSAYRFPGVDRSSRSRPAMPPFANRPRSVERGLGITTCPLAPIRRVIPRQYHRFWMISVTPRG